MIRFIGVGHRCRRRHPDGPRAVTRADVAGCADRVGHCLHTPALADTDGRRSIRGAACHPAIAPAAYTGVVQERSPAGEMGVDEPTYRLHAPRLMALAAALAGPSRADDVLAGAVLRVMQGSQGTVDDPGTALTRAVVNEARTITRSELRRSAREARSAALSTRAASGDGDPELLAALLRLPIQQRAVTFLTYWADLAPGAVAEQLGISDGSVRKQLARARAALRKELA